MGNVENYWWRDRGAEGAGDEFYGNYARDVACEAPNFGSELGREGREFGEGFEWFGG
jgi:hypothetical protein